MNENITANFVRVARERGTGSDSRSRHNLNIYLLTHSSDYYYHSNFNVRTMNSCCCFSISPTDAREIALKYSHQFFSTITYSNARGPSFYSADVFFIQNTQQILCFIVVFLYGWVGVVIVWGEVAFKLQTLWLYFFLRRQMEIMGQWKLNQRRRAKVGKENAVKLGAIKSTQEKKNNWITERFAYILMMTKMMNFSASIYRDQNYTFTNGS